MFPVHKELSVREPSQVGEARRQAAIVAKAAGFDEVRAGQAAIIATELATNLVKHAREGTLLLRSVENGLELLSLDKGPGITNFRQCLEDGYSTAGSAGNGLGAISRLSDHMDVYSGPDGTVIHVLLHKPAEYTPASEHPFATGTINVAYKGEQVSGDSFLIHQTSDRAVFMLADGLGHGPLAATAAGEAVLAVRSAGIPERTAPALPPAFA
jgi:anti-sigma regulatory factor (Ser/Thr protein kinase)